MVNKYMRASGVIYYFYSYNMCVSLPDQSKYNRDLKFGTHILQGHVKKQFNLFIGLQKELHKAKLFIRVLTFDGLKGSHPNLKQ